MSTDRIALDASISIPPREVTTTLTVRNVQTTLNYYRNPGDGSPPTPVYVGGNTVQNERPTIPVSVTIRDVTGSEKNFTLDTHGFQFIKHESAMKLFDSESEIKEGYYPECVNLYKQITGASRVLIFGHLVRRGPTHWHSLGNGNAANKGPLHRVHVDQSYAGAELILRKQLLDEAESTLARENRWQIVNLWRPVSTIFKDPLAVAAAASISEDDLVEAKVLYTNQSPPWNRNETWAVQPGQGHSWFFKNEQKPDDVLLIKCFDSDEKVGVARRAPHCAFRDPEREGHVWNDRESIEVRALLFYN
ncbi:hypothetical protein BU24DRAFT_463615 [Aaosphaeria arxii CBS 175.79]|uniref:GA4 desaturase family protein n=1 Tax=Aaosphaeria arxii CBS 175.79 TaxID=1450172 RepID=A0A6A5XQ35_9PLEO|nr:uncharacterized protein BU24DRAFT_463615 [Aaosphaeria arxii CBS 175.79]KAF2014871.1 hypothetical protein BU24DRAFT_463615 [Aaosphaeria arxii CBS 175.79]